MRRKVEIEEQKDCMDASDHVLVEGMGDQLACGSKAVVQDEVGEDEVEILECEEGEDLQGMETGTQGHQGLIEALA